MKETYLLIVMVILLASCAPSPSSIQTAIAGTSEAWTPISTNTAFPTYTSVPTIFITKIVTVEKLVTATFTATPLYTPTDTPTPTATPDMAATGTALTNLKLKADKSDGFYLINIDIAPGVWRSTGTGDSCYWAVTSKTGNILDNHFGMAGGTAYISPNGFQVEFNGCGMWVYLSP